MLTRIIQPACADLLEGLSGGGVWGRRGRSGKDLRETPPLDLRRRGDLQPIGKPANCDRGRENEKFFGTEDVSDPDDTPEDVEDEEEPEFCEATSRSVRRLTLFNTTRRGLRDPGLAHEVEAYRNISREAFWNEKFRVTVEDQSLFLTSRGREGWGGGIGGFSRGSHGFRGERTGNQSSPTEYKGETIDHNNYIMEPPLTPPPQSKLFLPTVSPLYQTLRSWE